MTYLIVHTGTDTFFDIEDEVYILNTEDIPEDRLADLENGYASDLAFSYGKPMNPELVKE